MTTPRYDDMRQGRWLECALAAIIGAIILAAVGRADPVALFGTEPAAVAAAPANWWDAYTSTALGLWPCDEGSGTAIDDKSAYAKDGTATGIGWSTRGPEFNGKSGCYIALPKLAWPATVTQATVAAWAYAKAWPGNTAVWGSYNGGPGLFLQSEIGAGAGIIGWVQSSYGLKVIGATNAWQHMAMVYNGGGAANSDRLKLFVNGTNVNCAFPGSIPSSASTNSWLAPYLGALNGLTRPWTGTVARVAVFKTALTETQIRSLRDASRP